MHNSFFFWSQPSRPRLVGWPTQQTEEPAGRTGPCPGPTSLRRRPSCLRPAGGECRSTAAWKGMGTRVRCGGSASSLRTSHSPGGLQQHARGLRREGFIEAAPLHAPSPVRPLPDSCHLSCQLALGGPLCLARIPCAAAARAGRSWRVAWGGVDDVGHIIGGAEVWRCALRVGGACTRGSDVNVDC